MLTDEQYAEVVEFDRQYRERDRRIDRLKKCNRRTIRYNYIVPCERKEKSLAEVLGYDKPTKKEVCIVNVAVRLDVNYVPIVKEVNNILFDGQSAKQGVVDLMARDRKSENTESEW